MVFLLTPQIQVKDFVLLAQPKSHKELYQCPLSLGLIIVLCCVRVESQRKRSRADDKSGTKKRGRPRKSEPTPELSVIQEEAVAVQDAPAVVVVPEPMGILSDQTSASLTPLFSVGSDTLESQPASVLAVPPEIGSVQTSVPAPGLSSPVNQTPALVPLSVPGPSPPSVLDTAQIPAQDPDPVPALFQAPVPAAAPSLVETLYTESQGRQALDQVLIEDLGPEEEEDISRSQDNRADEGRDDVDLQHQKCHLVLEPLTIYLLF